MSMPEALFNFLVERKIFSKFTGLFPSRTRRRTNVLNEPGSRFDKGRNKIFTSTSIRQAQKYFVPDKERIHIHPRRKRK